MSSMKSSFLYLSIFDHYESNDWSNERGQCPNSTTQETFISQSEDTMTPLTAEAQSRIASRDTSGDIDRNIMCLNPEELANQSKSALNNSMDSISISSSTQSSCQQNAKDNLSSDPETKPNASNTVLSKLQKKRDKFRWFEKLTGRVSWDSTDSHIDDDHVHNYETKPVPTHLLQHKGPECPFIVGTKDFELYAKFLDEKPE